MPVEIDETRLSNLNTLAQMYDAMLKNPKTRGSLLRTVKEAFPQTSIPEIDAAAPINSEIADLKKSMADFIGTVEKKFDEDRTARVKSQVDDTMEKGRALMRGRGYTPEGIVKVEEMMTQEGISDYNNALKIWEHDHPLPTVARPGRSNMFELIDESSKPQEQQNDYVKALMATRGDDEGVLNRQIDSVLRESRGQ